MGASVTGGSISDKEELLDSIETPHLSHARISRYLTCPEQYRLYYVENLRPRVPSSRLVFGAVIHNVLAELFRNGTDALLGFLSQWEELVGVDLHYKERETWEVLKEKGEKLIGRFMADELPRLRTIHSIEKHFDLMIASIPLPFVGIVDLVAEVAGGTVVVDFKTASCGYDKHEVALSDQLTAYSLAEPSATKVAYCVFVKTKEPRIEWHFAERTPADRVEYVEKARLVGADILAGKFYKRPGKHCTYCDFLPVCTGDKRKARETLVQIT
jgi:CRISPR/Cas system-associated exonuclease Cas4 (RecB family)